MQQEKMKLSKVIFLLGYFSISMSFLGFLVWENYSFLNLIIIAIALNLLSVHMENHGL
ncbi:hypothetical protein LCGC14_0477700 [marine sediment metagenome]|uniref:Uncharacterized protein n=1 Tax=marine sediment metagenome TaxID=412755 RepID=A0A0F9SFN2_9ZZZZ